MEYHGKLYGKIGNKHFDTGKTSKDFDDMVNLLKCIYDAIENEDIIIKDNNDFTTIESFGYYLHKNIKQIINK